MCWTHAGNVNVKQHYNPTKLPSFNMLSWLYCSCLTCLQLFFFFLFGHFPLLGGVIYVLTCVCAFYKAPCELEIWQLFASPGLWLTDVILAVQAVRVVELNLQPGTGRIQVKSPGREIQQLQHERLEAVKSKWEDVFRAFCVFITRIYGRIPGCDTA